MSDKTDPTGPVFDPQAAPDHGPDFWTNLQSSLEDPTSELPTIGTKPPGIVDPESTSTVSRRLRPLAAAAAVLALVGIGALALRGGSGTATEVVAGQPTAGTVVPLDGPADDGTSDTTDQDSESRDQSRTEEPAPPGLGPVPVPTAAPPAVDSRSAGAVDQPSFDPAPGAMGKAVYLPADGGIPEGSTFLGTWDERRASFYGVTDPDLTCADTGYSEIRFTNESGLTQLMRDPQKRFSGELSHLLFDGENSRAGWLTSCGNQVEFSVAELDDAGSIVDVHLVWVGQASISNALMLWTDDEISLSTFGAGPNPVSIEYDFKTRHVTQNGRVLDELGEDGAPAGMTSTPLIATADGRFTYWKAPTGVFERCLGGENLWLRQGENRWVEAVEESLSFGAVTAIDVEPEFAQIAWADACAGSDGRLFVGTQRADGRISNVREIDLAPYVPGFAERLIWIDSTTLRVETNNDVVGALPVRYNLVLDDGRQNGVMVRLDN